MAQDNIKNLYEALKNDYDLGSEQDFRNSLKDANNRRNLYNAIGNDYDLGSEQDFEKSLGYDTESAGRTESAGAFTQEEYGKLSPTAQEVAQGVGVAPNNGPNKPNEPNKADLQRVQEGMQRVQAREPKAQFVPEASNIVMATPTAETLKRYPWLKADEAVPFNRETGEPLYTWTDEQGRPISRSEIGIRTAKQEITGEREYMQQQPASLELPDSNARAMRLDGSLTEYVDVLMKEKYGDDYLNGTFTTADGRQVSGSELMTETAQQQYNELNNDINNARIEYLDADEGQRKELVDALSKKYQGLLTRESIERTMNDEQAQIEARETQRQRERQQIDEAYNKAYTDRAAVMQENARKAKEEYENSSWLDRMFGGNPVQRAYWMNQNDKRIQIADTQINIALDARRVLDTGKAYDDGESWSGRLVRGMRDAMTDTGLYDGGVEEMHDLRNVKEAVDAYEAGTATDAQKDLLDTYSLLTMVNGENADALGGMYGAGQMTIQAIPFMAQMYINPIGSLGQSTMKAATRFGVRTFGRSMMNQYMKRLLTTSLKAGGRVTGDMLAAALPAMTFGAPAIGADMYDRLIGNVRGTRNEQGNVEYSGRDNAETSKAAAIAKSIGSNYLEYQSEMVGEYFRPLSNIISSGIGRATDKLGLGKVRDMIANISNKDFYRAYADFARRTQWQGTFNEYLEEVVNNVENALFIGDMDFSTDENGVFNLDTNIDTFLGVAVMSGFMSSLKTVDYIRTKGRLKDALDNAYTSGLDVFGTKEWQRITNEIDGLDDKTAASAVKKMLNNVDSDEKKRTIINYATAALANQGFNAGELKNSLEQVSDAAVNGGVPQDAIPRIENLAPEERQNVHVDGMIHAAVLYPTAENNGQPQEVFITRGNVVMREDGTIDTEASDKEIYYKGVDGQVHIVSPDKLQAVAEPISVEDYVAANRPNEANEPDMAEEIVPGQVVNINVDGQTFQATVQGTDGNGNVSVYYQDANGMDRPATFTIDEIRNANRPNNEEPPVGGAGAVVENAEPNGTNEPNASQTAEDRMPIDVSEYFGNAEEAMVTAKDIIQNGEVIGTLPDGSVQMQKDGFVATLMPDGNGGMNVTGIERTGNNAPQNIPENGNIGAKNIQQTDGISTENGGIPAENIQQEQQIPQDDEGNLIYDQVPVETTIADLYDGSLNDEEVQGFIDANIADAQKKYDSVQKKTPKIGTNKAKYLEQKRKWQADVDEAKRVLDYWNEVNSQKQALTHTTEEETQAAQAELSGQNAREEFNQYNENGVNDAVSVASGFIRGAKITPESFRAETGYGTGEQRRFVGMIATEQNGGKSIDRLAEELVSYDNAELNGVTFNGDTSAAKDAILEALQSAGTRGELTTDNTAEQERYVEARRAELDAQCMEAYGMTYEDYLAYEEQNLPEMLRKYANFDEVEFYNLYADEIEQSLNARINEQGNDTAGEEPRTGGGNEVLPEQGIGNAGGSEGGTEQGTEVPAGVQGTVENGAVPEKAQQLEPEPIGTNRFGNIYNWVKGQFQSAASFLNNLKSGYLRGVFYRDGIGNIDMVWGNEKAGLQHIINKHIEEADDFNSVEEAMQVINETINNGTISQQGTNISLDYKGYRVSIAQSNEGNWVLTAFDKTRSRAEKQRNKGNATIGDQSVSDMENGTLVSPQLASSESKDTQTSANEQTVGEKIAQEEAKVEQNPTEAQKEAGNYKKGHVKIDGYDVTIENPKGSVRSGVDRNGQEWSVTMNNTYGYIRGTEGVDGDHIDVFLSDDPTQGDVYVIDQVNENGSFDEHKVMYGFNSVEEARDAYLANYSPGWQGLGTIIEVSKEEFKKWINSSHRKIKPFAEYKSVNKDGAQNEGNGTDETNEPDRPLSLADIREVEPQPTDVVEQTVEVEQEQTTESDGYGANNKLVSRDRYEELKKRMRQKLGGQLNVGIDPEILAIGTEMAAYHIEAGARKFADYARHMIDDLGDAIRPYLKSFYNGARDLPEVLEAGLADEMTPYDVVRTFDTANFDKPTVNAIETARTVVQEQEVNKQAEEAKNAITEQRNEKERQKRSRNKKKSVSSQQTPDLFGNVNAEQNQEDDNYGLQRNDGAVRAEGLPTDRGDTEEPSGSMGETVGQESGRPDRSGEESGSGELRRSLQQSERLDGQLTPRNRNNNHVERGTDYAPTTPKARYDANVEAVRLAKELTDSGQQATDEQKAILRQFSGWGGLGTFFNNERTRNELVALLGDDGYQQAAMSINSAYYTPADVIDAMWDIVKNLGFKGGNILEGSAGIGNILGLMPMDISDRSNIEAVEIDGVSGMILKLLYPDAKVDIQGFENTQVRNGSVDLAITNVPFVTGLHVHDTTGDRDLSRRFGNIHDFCIAKNVRKLREGGIGVFISSSGTLDKSKALRDWVVNEGNADFIGAFRLNNKTFGGTTATSDIIVVRKRVNGNKSAGAINLLDTESVRTVSVPINDNGREKIKPVVLQYNKYFVEHPENMGGKMALNYERGETFRPEGSGLFPTTDINQEERMQQWAETFKDKAVDVPQPQTEEPADTQTDTNGNEIKDGTIVVGEDGSINVMYLGRQEPLGVNDKKVKGHTKAECVEDYNRIKRALNAVLEYETTNEKDDGLKPLLKELNDAYDSFKDKYGNLNKNTAISFLRNDIDFPSIQALEKFNETNDKDGKRIVQTEKTSIFTERVVQKEVEPHPTNVLDAVKTSVFRSGRIDLDYISNALGRDVSDIEKEIIDNGLGYRDPATGNMEVSYEYLSGNVRQKLAIAEANNEDGRYDKNIKALRKVMPMDIPAHLIEFTFGSSWVNPKLFSDYVNEKTGVPVTLTNVGGQWNMDLPYYTATEKNKSEGVRSEKLNKIVLGTDLMNAAINNRTITVSTTQRTWDGRTETITDKEATQACAAKIDDIRNDFKDWARAKMQSDPEMAKEIEQVYNERFNNYVPKTVTEEFMPDHFPGATKMINLYPHQKKAVIRATSQPLMLAHEVGTGKTFTLITTAMEMRRLGLARKPMIVVQNATVGQFVASAKELYPNAKVLTIADNERNEEGRKRFYAKIKYNDWDMIVVPQSVFERIPDSEERQMDFINDRIEEKEHVLEQIQEIDPKSMIARNAKRELDSLQTELAEVSDKKRQKDEKRAAKTRQNAAAKAQEQLDRATDDVENFDDMEIDAVLVDEAHEYKHLGFSTAMQRGVKGVDPSYSKKSAGVYLKTRAVMEKSNGKNVVFATGTPISNTAAEIWTFMRYLMPKHTMEEYGIYYFDDFVRNFGNLTQMLEFTTSGKFRENNRFSGYVNIPELIRIWSSVSDTVLTKETNLKDKLPETVDGGQKATDIYLPQSASLRSIMKAVRAELERFDNMSGKEKKENSAIPLVMYGIAKAAAIDPRLVMAEAADEPVSKTNRAVEETLKSLEATKDYKGTVAIFCDTYQNNQTSFNIYEEIKRKLVERGVPENQIVIMRSGMSVNKKAEIFDKVNAGDVRVIMGSTFTLGTGVNIQERLNTLIHLDAPNRPMDYTQRNGRILRQGNLHKQWGLPVKILRFGVEDSLDITAYQRLKTKGAIADSVMEGKKFINNNQQDRTLEEQEDVFGDTVAQLSGSEYALLKNQAERDFRKYNNKKKQYETDQIYVHNAIPRYEGQIKRSEDTIKQQQKALTAVEKAFPDGTVQEITIGNSKLSGQKAIGDYIKDVVNKRQTETEDKVRKGAQGTKASSSFTIKAGPFTFTVNTEYSKDTEFQNGSLFPVVHRNMIYSCDELGLFNVPVQRASFKNAVDDIMNNVLSGNDMRERIETENNSIERNRSELEQLKSREGKPFENEKELEDARKKVEEYTEKMRKEMEAKEQKYAEMDAQTQSADLGSLSGAEEAEEDGETLYREADGYNGNISVSEEEANDLFRVVDDASEIERLNSEPTVKVYRAMSLVDGKLYPPMSKKIGTGSNRVSQAPSEFGQWEVSDERPEFVEKEGAHKNHIYIVKDNGKGLWVAYNPYFHTSRNPLNDQFAEAYQRPNLVTVEVEVPESELTSGYQAEGAKDPVGETKWNAGPVNRQLSGDKKRKVILSRWMRPVRIVPDSEVAQHIAELIEGEDVAIPDNTVTPSLLEELKKLGVKIVDGISKGRKKASAMMRGGSGALTDDELSLANDPAAALTGRSTRTSAQRRRFAERERQRMVDAVQKLARKLNLDNVDIVTDASTLQGRRARAKGFYSRSTGRITIVIPNHMDIRDVEQTLLHEAVAHYGLRQLFGEHFDTFLDNVYNNVDPELKQRIDAMSQQRGWSTRTATEEYLASLAENTNFEDMNASWWDKIKRYFLRMLHEIGFEGFKSFEYISDNELRYLLWRSYENLAEPGRYRSIMGEVRDIAKQHELNVGNYSSSTDVTAMSAENDVRFREADEAEEDLSREWQDEYDRRTLSAVFKFTEAAQDGMKSVSILQDVISKETDKPIKEDENVWALQNRLSSTNKYEQDYFYENYYKPLMMAVGNLVKAGARYNELGRNMEDAQDDILKYLISKHGIERNAHFREVAAMEARRPYEESIEEIRKAVANGEITQVNADKQIDKLTEQANEAEEKSRIDTMTRDYSGLSELYNNKMDFDALAEQYVLDFESKFDTADLWNKINAATKTTLRKTYEAGLISRSGYEATRDMYQYYIPLRGWSNDVASEMYNYKGQQGVGGRIMKRAKGRKSLAENPLAVIGRMGQDGILQANKNRVKQRLYNLAIGHDTSLLSISKQWYVNEGTKENPDWQRAYPELSGDMGADEVAAALKEFDEKMKALKDEGMATQRRDGLTLKYHTTTAQEQQHRVNVSIGGREYNIYVNGNPRAAQAINGELRMDDEGNSIIQRVNRWLANVYTSLNPEFVVTNYERDAGFAAAIVAATETPAYQAGWIKNMAKFNPLTTGIYINHLISKSTKGQINPDNTTERYMQEFLANGGETGFTNMLTADDYKKLIKKEIKEVNKPITASKAGRVCFGWAQRANRVFEDATRFATYVTSREQGRSIDRSIRDAKEISLNFNTRGADGMKNDGVVHKLFRNLRRWIIFTNPSIQGLNKAGVAFRNHPIRSTIAIAGLPVLLGYGMAALASALLGDDDDEKVREAYMDLPKWVRRTNICIPIGGTKFVTIPLSYELRVSYGMGEMFWEIEQGLIEPGELAKETLTQISDLLPLSFASGTVAQNVSPTIVRPLVDIIQNKDFTGRPIWRENTFNQNMPEYTKAYAGTAKWFTQSAEVLNNAIPKFWIKDYPSPDKYTPGALDINPAIVEHLFDSYLGGLYTFPAKAAKTISMVWDEDMRDVRNIPFINRNLKDSRSGNPINRSAGDRYNTYMKEYRLSKQRWDGYRRETNHGVTEFLDKLINFGNTPQGQRMFIIDGYKKSLDDIDKQIKDMGQYEGYGGDEERKRLKELSDSLKQELVNKLDSVSIVED